LDHVVNQFVLYGLLVLGAIGVCLALPRRGVNPQPIGALIAAAAGGLLMLVLGVAARDHLPNLYFYVFAAIALGGSLRVITHPRPVYAALYFILTILASAGLFVILAAEFVAFALIIVYAGAILITYLFVIMLATQAPTEDQLETLADYDRAGHEPIAAAGVGFLLLGVLTTMLFGGLRALPPAGELDPTIAARLPGKARLMEGLPAAVATPEPTNTERVAFDLLADHPGSIEIAGVILLMAMLGAVVLARKQVQIDEEAKARQAGHLSPEEAAP
jgi:NADH-quinone oxidoreductase subunit J